jgi:trk system potassium uptake protein TrkH
MRIAFKNKRLEGFSIGLNIMTGVAVVATFVALFGFTPPLLSPQILYVIQAVLLLVFIAEKIIRSFNAVSLKELLRVDWYEIPLLLVLGITLIGAGRWFALTEAPAVRHFAIGIYLFVEVVAKSCRTVITLAAAGKNPTSTLIASFVVLIISGAGLLMLPKASADGKSIGFVDALFTSTSATCVTGLIVKDTGANFSLMGQMVILSLIQLGGLGIVVFGAVFALLLGQALSISERVAMGDLLSSDTLGRIGRMITFIFTGTMLIEAVGAIAMYNMWDDVPSWTGGTEHQWFCTVFHSISAFCNAGFSLFGSSLINYKKCAGVYLVICPLIVLGGLGFGVLFDLFGIIVERVKRFFVKLLYRQTLFSMEVPRRMHLQTKIVLSATVCLIVFGMLLIVLFENFTGSSAKTGGVLDALFQSITARTAGFNTVDIAKMSDSSRILLTLLMFIGGSPGSTAGGIKTVTLVIILMTAVATLRKREQVEIFKRSIRLIIIRRAFAVASLFILILVGTGFALSITERSNHFTMMQIMFEAGSALGTVGLTMGITGSLTTAGKLIIIIVMLVGRLGPLTLLAALTFNLRPARYQYPEEAVIVG